MYNSNLVAVRYSVPSAADLIEGGAVAVRDDSTFVMGQPVKNGLFDDHMGTTDSAYRCATCRKGKDQCHGHAGYFAMKYPCMNPLFSTDIRKWLKIICFECGQTIVSDETIAAMGPGDKLDAIVKSVGSGVRPCAHCGRPHKYLRQSKQLAHCFTLHNSETSGAAVEANLYAHDIDVIFNKISDKTVLAVGRKLDSHPRGFIMSAIPVPPPMTRPDTKKMGARGTSSNNSVTSLLRDVIKFSSKNIMDAIPHPIDEKYARVIDELHETVAALMTGSNEDQKSIGMGIKGKTGLIRDCLCGKRTFLMARATIYGNPTLNLDQLSVPLWFVRKLQVKERVHSYNRERLLAFVANGTRRYPGCTRVTKGSGAAAGKSFEPGAPGLKIEDGDIIARDLVDGDVVSFNRQPSLMMSNITSFRITVDHVGWSIGMNDITVSLFGADFDGDQMNIIGYDGSCARNEIRNLTMVADRIVSMTTGSVTLGLLEDSKVGTTKLTQSGMEYDKYHAMLMFSTTTTIPTFENRIVTGREIISKVFERTPIDFKGKSKYYDADNQWMQWIGMQAPDDAQIEMRAGRLLKGCLDGSLLGAGSAIFHTIIRDHGEQRAIDAIFDAQQLSINAVLQCGFTAGMRDLILPKSTRDRIDEITNDLLAQAELNTRKLYRGEIIPPVDQTVVQYYENMQIGTLKILDDYVRPIVQSIADGSATGIDALTKLRGNGAFEMMASGSKGNMVYFTNMCSCIGLTLLNGARVPESFGSDRTLVYFQRSEENPIARGFAVGNYIRGMSVSDYIYNAMQARVEIISKALMTSVTGEQNRKSIQSLESMITNNYGWSVKGAAIVSFAYGGDYYDPRYIAAATYGPALISDKALEAGYRFAGGAGGANIAVFDAEFAAIKADRAEYRAAMKNIEDQGMAREKMGAVLKFPFNIQRILGDLVREVSDNDAAPGARVLSADEASASSARGVELVRKFVEEEALYLFINEIQFRKRGFVPAFVSAASTAIRIYVRAELCAAKVAAAIAGARKGGIVITPENLVRATLDRIRTLVALARISPGMAVGIIAGQSFSEPFTQMMLDSYKVGADGGPPRAKVSKCREIMAARDVPNLSNPTMLVMLTAEYSKNAQSAQLIATRLEMLRLSQLVARYQIFYEQFGAPIHPDYAHEAKTVYEEFARANPLISVPSGIMPWCVRYEIDKNMLVMKNVDMTAIIIRLRELFQGVHFVYTTERARNVVIRAHPTTAFRVRGKRGDQSSAALQLNAALLEAIVRGIDGIRQAKVEKIVRTRVEQTPGDAFGAVVDDAKFCVRTQGTNLARVFLVPGVDASLTQTDAVREVARVLGIEAARPRIISEMRGLVEKCNVRHYMLYADEMTRSGNVTSIDRSGLSQREVSNVSLRAGLAAPVQVLADAASHSRREVVSGVSGPLILGNTPRLGTNYNQVIMDHEMLAAANRAAVAELDAI